GILHCGDRGGDAQLFPSVAKGGKSGAQSSAATAPVEPARVVPQATAAAATTPACTQHARWAEAKAALVLDDLRSTTREYEQHQKQASPMLKSAGCRSRSRVRSEEHTSELQSRV